MRKFFAAISLAGALVAAPAYAAPSILSGGPTSPNVVGTTGLLFAPSAYTVGDRGISGGIFGSENFTTYSVLFGVTDRIEVGGSYADSNGKFGDRGFLGNAKFKALKESRLLPALSVGVVDAFDQLGVDPSFYVVASKDLNKMIPLHLLPLRAHLGYGSGIYDEDIFAGVEMDLWTPANLVPLVHPTFTAMAEYVHQDVNVGLRAKWRGFAATLGLFDFDHFGGGISYTTGLRLK